MSRTFRARRRVTARLPSKGEPGAAGDAAPPCALLAELAREPDGISLPRLCTRMGWRMSVLMRALAWLGEEPIGGHTGPGQVRVERRGGRGIAPFTTSGHPRIPSERKGARQSLRVEK